MYQRIRDLREDRDLLQKDVAAYLKCTQVCYSNYETGKRDIPTEVLIQLAGLYHTSTDYILGLTDDSAPPIPAKRKTAPKVARIKSRYFGGSLFDIKIFHYGPAWKGSCKRVHTASSMQE